MMQLCPCSAQAAAADPKYKQDKGHSIISLTLVILTLLPVYIDLFGGLSEYEIIGYFTDLP